MKTNLRDYQRGVVAKVIAALDRRKRTLLVAPTGSGKTVMFAEVVAHYAAEGLPVLVLAHRRELLTQAADKLAAAGVEASVYRGKGAPFEPRTVVVASVQTGAPLGFRARLVVVDEAHHAPAKSYRRAVAKHKGAVVLGVTATPWWQSTRHLDGEFKETVRAPGVRELTELGYLARVRMFTHPHTLRDLDLRGVATAGGDYAPRAVCDRVDRPALLGDIVEHWKAHAPGERTLAFAASVAHSLHIVARFVAAGVTAEHLDGDTPDAERKAILRRLEVGETLVVSSYNVLTEGLDVPAVGCVILARPTKRLGVYRQCVGRGMRRAEGKDSVVVLDHAGSCLAFGLPDEEVDIADPKRAGGGKPPVRHCPSCGLCVHPSLMSCPECTAALRHEVPTAEPTGTLVEFMCGSGTERRMFRGEMHTAPSVHSLTGVSRALIYRWFRKGVDIDRAVARHKGPMVARQEFRGEMRTAREVSEMTGISQNTVRKWFRESRNVDDVAAKHATRAARRLMFRGEMRTAREVSEMTGILEDIIYRWFAKSLDIDEAMAGYKPTAEAKRRMFRGEMRTAREVSEMAGIPMPTANAWFTKGRDIDAAVASHKSAPKTVARMFDGEARTIREVSEMTGVHRSTVGTWFRKGLDIDAAVANRARKAATP